MLPTVRAPRVWPQVEKVGVCHDGTERAASWLNVTTGVKGKVDRMGTGNWNPTAGHCRNNPRLDIDPHQNP